MLQGAARADPRPLARELQRACRQEFIAIDANELISAYLNMANVFVLSPEGRDILKASGFQAIAPATVPAWGKAPDFLQDLAIPES